MPNGISGTAGIGIAQLAQKLDRLRAPEGCALSFAGADKRLVLFSVPTFSGRTVRSATPKEIEWLTDMVMKDARETKGSGTAAGARERVLKTVQKFVGAGDGDKVVTARHVQSLAQAIALANGDLGLLEMNLNWAQARKDPPDRPGATHRVGPPGDQTLSKTDFRKAAVADSKRAGDSSDSDSDGAEVMRPRLHQAPATSAKEFGQFPQAAMDLEDTRAVWNERLAKGHGAGVLRAIERSLSEVKPYPGPEGARASYRAQDAGAWLSTSRFVADACVPATSKTAPCISMQDVHKHLTLSVRVSMLAALAQTISHNGADAASSKEDRDRLTRLAAAFSDQELMPAELDSRVEAFRREMEAALGDIDWAHADQASRVQALGMAVQAVSIGENLGLDMFTPVRLSGEQLAVLARYDGKAQAIAVSTRAGWDDPKAVVSAVVYELSLRHASSLADQLSRGQAPRGDSMHQLARIMLASERGASLGLAQRHAQVFAARVMAEDL